MSIESRKMLLMNPLAGQQWRCRHREQTCDIENRLVETEEEREVGLN